MGVFSSSHATGFSPLASQRMFSPVATLRMQKPRVREGGKGQGFAIHATILHLVDLFRKPIGPRGFIAGGLPVEARGALGASQAMNREVVSVARC